MSLGSETLHTTSEGFGEMFEGGVADMCACVDKGPSELVKGAQTGSEDLIVVRGNLIYYIYFDLLYFL